MARFGHYIVVLVRRACDKDGYGYHLQYLQIFPTLFDRKRIPHT